MIRGNLLVVPLSNSFLYVEPVYLLSDTSALPELKRVIVASDTRIAMGQTLAEALTGLMEGAPTTIEIPVEEPDGGGEAPSEPSAPPALDSTVEELIISANAHFEAAEAAQRQGDWATYGAELEALQRDLDQLSELTGGTP